MWNSRSSDVFSGFWYHVLQKLNIPIIILFFNFSLIVHTVNSRFLSHLSNKVYQKIDYFCKIRWQKTNKRNPLLKSFQLYQSFHIRTAHMKSIIEISLSKRWISNVISQRIFDDLYRKTLWKILNHGKKIQIYIKLWWF